MAEEQKQPEVEGEGEEKKKSPMVKIILLAVGIIVLLIGSVVGTLFASGFFSKKAPSADELLDAHEKAGADGRLRQLSHAHPAIHRRWALFWRKSRWQTGCRPPSRSAAR